ncbi:hypothetical protein CC1G_04500 [Coprinopsis cinerea okayama7|uniref:Uncharacterized protein n=1 Tax=Coprinopsis cinerea (strain Okayama-7 / 130 / ATCC MYA-4618 / FGSC 9003) TaxID=240176 RepID=A8N5C2_COPC7|nr:hypothetical protein CC1G_04500 [Coprinopsis cinerea okayama7\|eukprot:XP_001830067.2 hypothetical protein CC1G_04500 [Coprinopsis cinerea okayama7\
MSVLGNFTWKTIGKDPALLSRLSSAPVANGEMSGPASSSSSPDLGAELLPAEDDEMGHHLGQDVEMQDAPQTWDPTVAFASNPGAQGLSLKDRFSGLANGTKASTAPVPRVSSTKMVAPAQPVASTSTRPAGSNPLPTTVTRTPGIAPQTSATKPAGNPSSVAPKPSRNPPPANAAVVPGPSARNSAPSTSRSTPTLNPSSSQQIMSSANGGEQEPDNLAALRSIFSSIPPVDFPNVQGMGRSLQALKQDTVSTATAAQKAAELAQQAITFAQESFQNAKACIASTESLQTRYKELALALEELSKENVSKKRKWDEALKGAISAGEEWIAKRLKEDEQRDGAQEALLKEKAKLEAEVRRLKARQALPLDSPEFMSQIDAMLDRKLAEKMSQGPSQTTTPQRASPQVQVEQPMQPAMNQQPPAQPTRPQPPAISVDIHRAQASMAQPMRHTGIPIDQQSESLLMQHCNNNPQVAAQVKRAVEKELERRTQSLSPTETTFTFNQQQPPSGSSNAQNAQRQEAALREKLKVRTQGADRHDNRSMPPSTSVSPTEMQHPRSNSGQSSQKPPVDTGSSRSVSSNVALATRPHGLPPKPATALPNGAQNGVAPQLPSPPNSSFDENNPPTANGATRDPRLTAPSVSRPASPTNSSKPLSKRSKRVAKKKSQEWESDSSQMTINRHGSDGGNLDITQPPQPPAFVQLINTRNVPIGAVEAPAQVQAQVQQVADVKPFIKEEPVEVKLDLSAPAQRPAKASAQTQPKNAVSVQPSAQSQSSSSQNGSTRQVAPPPLPSRAFPPSVSQPLATPHEQAPTHVNPPPFMASAPAPASTQVSRPPPTGPSSRPPPSRPSGRSRPGSPSGRRPEPRRRMDSYVPPPYPSSSYRGRSPSPRGSSDYYRSRPRHDHYSPSPPRSPPFRRSRSQQRSPPPSDSSIGRKRPYESNESSSSNKRRQWQSGSIERLSGGVDAYDPANLPPRAPYRNGSVNPPRHPASHDDRRDDADGSSKPSLLSRLETETEELQTQQQQQQHPSIIERIERPPQEQVVDYDGDEEPAPYDYYVRSGSNDSEAERISLGQRLTDAPPTRGGRGGGRGRGRGGGRGGRGSGGLRNRISSPNEYS